MRRDCPNAEVRDRLPELMHGRIPAADRARIESHVATCPDCRAELDLLKRARSELTGPRIAVDASRIAAAVLASAPVAPPVAPPVAGRRSPVGTTARSRLAGWRVPTTIAAAIAFIALGAMALVIANRAERGPDGGEPRLAQIDSPALPSADSPASHGAARAPGPAAAGRPAISFGGGLADLSESELESLLSALESSSVVPGVEPAPAVDPIVIGLEG